MNICEKQRRGVFYGNTRYKGVMVLSGLGYLTVRWYCPCKISLWSDMKKVYKEMTKCVKGSEGSEERVRKEMLRSVETVP